MMFDDDDSVGDSEGMISTYPDGGAICERSEREISHPSICFCPSSLHNTREDAT